MFVSARYNQIQSDTVRYELLENVHVYVCGREIQSKYSRIHTDMNLKMQSDTVRYSQKQSDMDCLQNCICACIQDKNSDTYMHICIDLNQSICPCMCLYVYCIQANMHLIQLLCERRYMQIHENTCRYIDVCITYTSCICYMDCVLSCAYVMHMQTVCHPHTYTYINPCVLYVLQIHARMHGQDH
jgi:hypothetical protein